MKKETRQVSYNTDHEGTLPGRSKSTLHAGIAVSVRLMVPPATPFAGAVFPGATPACGAPPDTASAPGDPPPGSSLTVAAAAYGGGEALPSGPGPEGRPEVELAV